MADTYRAHDTGTGDVVAIKIAGRNGGVRPGMAVRFQNEHDVLRRLNHPSIVRALDVGRTEGSDQEPGRPYLVLEFLDGAPIQQLLSVRHIFSIGYSCMIVAEMLSGLTHAHQHGIVHGDLSPGNVMICTDGRMKLIDFGAAHPTGESDTTLPDPMMRTPRFMAPEQARGHAPRPQSDVYGCGCLLYTLLTGQPPFTGDDPIALAYQHVHQSPVPPSAHRAQIPQRLDHLVLQALAKNPGDRPDIRDLRRGLYAVEGTRPAVPTT